MAILTVEIPDALKDLLDREIASGRFRDSSVLVQSLLEIALPSEWREQAEQKIDEALGEIERGDTAAWKKGDASQ